MTELLDESIGPQWGELIVYDREDREKGSFPVVSNTLIGRCKDCDIRIRRPDVSREHAVISFENNRAWLTQLSNTNATRINRKPISKGSICLRDGDVLHISDRKMMFVYDERFKGFGTPETLNQVPEEFQGSNDYDSLDQTMAFDTLNVLKENNQPSIDAPSSVKKSSRKSAKKTPALTPSSRKTSMDADAARASLIRQQLDALREKSHIAQSKFAAQFLTEEDSTSTPATSVDENQINTAAQIVDEDNGTSFVDENDENDVDVSMDNVDSVSNHKNTLPTPIRRDIQSKRQSFVPHEDSDGASAHYVITPPDSKTSNRATSRKSACRSASRINARHSLGGVSLASFFSAAEAEAEAAEEAEAAAQNDLDQTSTFEDDEDVDDVDMTPSTDENRMMMVNVSNGPSEGFMQETETVELSSKKTPKSSKKMANATSSNKKTPKSVSKTSRSTTRPSSAKNVKLQGTTTRRSSLDSVVSVGNMFQTSEDENDTNASASATTTTTEFNSNSADVQDKESMTNSFSKSKALNTPIRRAIRARRKSYSRSFMTQRQPDTIKEHDDDVDDEEEENDQDMVNTNDRLSVSSAVHDTQTKLVDEFENVGQGNNSIETKDKLQQKTPVKTNAKLQHRLKTPIRHEIETYSVRHSRVIRKPPRTSIGSIHSTTMDENNKEENEEVQQQQMHETFMETEPVHTDTANNSADIVDADMELTTALTNHKPLATPLRKAIMARRKSYGPHVSLFSPDRLKTPSESVNSTKKQTRRSSLKPSSASRRSSLLPSSASASRRSSTHRRVSFGTSSVISVGELFETEDAQQLEESGIFSYQAVSSEEGNIHLFFDNDGSIVRSVFEPIDSTLKKSSQEKSLAGEEDSASIEETSMHVQDQEALDETEENLNSIEWEDLSMEEVSDLIVSGAIPSLPISIKRAIHSLRSPTGKHTISGGMHSRYAARKSMGLGSGTDRPNSHLVFDENADEDDTNQQDVSAVSSSNDTLNKDTKVESMHSRYAARRSMGMGSGRGRPNKHVLLDENQAEYKIVANENHENDDEGKEAEEDETEEHYEGEEDEIDNETYEIIEEDNDLEEEEAQVVDTSMHDETEKETQQFHSKYAARASLGLGNGEGRPNRHVIFTDADNHSDVIETNAAEQDIDADTDNHSDTIETNDVEQGIDASNLEGEINSSDDKIATMILSQEEQPLRQSIADAISQEDSHTSDSDSVDRVIEYDTAAEKMPEEQVKDNVTGPEADQENEPESEEEIEQEIEDEQIDSNKAQDQFNVEDQQPTQEDETTPVDATLEQVPFADEEEEEEEIYLFEPQLETIQETDIETELESAAPHSAFTRRTRHTTTPSTMHRSRRIGTTFATSPNEQIPGEKRQLSFEMNDSNMPTKKRARQSIQSNNQTTQQEKGTDSYATFQRMTVAKLQKQLKQQGLSTAGRKAELIDRLMTAQLDNAQEASKAEISSSSNISTEQQQQEAEEAEEPIDTEMTQAEESMSQEEDTSTESDKEEELTAGDIQQMKVVELRAELAARDLSTAGRKADLMDRLLNAIDSASNDDDASGKENDENVQEKFEGKNTQDIEANNASEDENIDTPQDIEENDASMKWSEEELSSMTVVQLRNELKALGLEVAGRKADLIQRLMESSNNNEDDDDEDTAKTSANTPEEEEEEANDLPEDLQALKVVELRQLLSERELSTSGRKAELIARLEETRA